METVYILDATLLIHLKKLGSTYIEMHIPKCVHLFFFPAAAMVMQGKTYPQFTGVKTSQLWIGETTHAHSHLGGRVHVSRYLWRVGIMSCPVNPQLPIPCRYVMPTSHKYRETYVHHSQMRLRVSCFSRPRLCCFYVG